MRLSVAVCLIALLATLSAPASGAVQENFKTDVLLTVFVPCAAGGAGEIVELSGTLHILMSFTINDNKVSGFYHFQPQGVSGTGLTTGLRYEATGITRSSFQGSLGQNGQFNREFVNNFRIIGQGPGNNYLVHETFHFTINANGDVTVVHDNFSVECK